MSSELQAPLLPGHKRRRLQGACDICKHKKIRCNSAEMPGGRCSNCIAFGSECTHVTAKKRGMSRSQPSMALHTVNAHENLDVLPRVDDSQRSTHSLIQSILSTSVHDGPNDNTTMRQSLAKLAQHTLNLEQELSTLREDANGESRATDKCAPSETSTTSTASTSAFTTNEDDDFDLSEGVKRLTIESSHNRFFGSSSTMMLVKAAMEMQKASNGGRRIKSPDLSVNLRPAFWNIHPWEYMPSEPLSSQHFPDYDLLMDLIQLFFDNVNIHFPLLHRPTFEKSIGDNLHLTNHLFGASVLALCAVASRYSNDGRAVLEGTDSLHSSGWKWFRQIKPFQKPFSQIPSVYELHTYCLSVLFLQGSSTPEASWTLIGVGIRFAQDVGAHRRKNNRKPSVEEELWKRAFWILTCMDTILCSIVGRPRATTSNDYDLDLPIDCDDEHWGATDTAMSFKQPPGQPSRVSSFITYLKLMEILDAAQRTIYSVNKSTRLLERPLDEHQVVTGLDSELNKWIDSVPDHLRWDPQRQNQIFFEQSAMLYATYYNIRILIHRPFIPSPMKPSPLPFPSLAICTNAARSCIHLMVLESRRGFMPLPQIQMALFSSAVVLLLNVWAGKLSGFSGDPGKDLQVVVNCLDVMRAYESRWLSAGRLSDTICELCAVGDIQLPSVFSPRRGIFQESLPEPQGGTEYFYTGGEGPAPAQLHAFAQELSDLLNWPLYSTDLGRSPDYRPFDGSLVGDNRWYQSSLYRGFTNPPEYGNPFMAADPGTGFAPWNSESAIS